MISGRHGKMNAFKTGTMDIFKTGALQAFSKAGGYADEREKGRIRVKHLMKGIKLAFLAVAAAILMSVTPAEGTQVQAAAISGIDVSAYQGDINWSAVAASGVKFAMIRLGNTKYGMDSKFAQNVAGANAAGIRVGVYVYSYALTDAEAAADAQLAVAAMKNLPVSFPVAIDIEDSTQSTLSDAQLLSIANTFCSIVYANGYQPMVYSYKNWLATRMSSAAWDRWVANYSDSIGLSGTMWQYTSSGSVAGIAGNVDMDYVLKDYFTSIPANGLSVQGGKTYYFVNYRRQFGFQTIGGLQFFFDGTGAMVQNQTTTDGQGNIIRICRDGHVVVITAAAQAQAAQLKAVSDQQAAILVQYQAVQTAAAQTTQAALTQYQTLQAAAQQAAVNAQTAAANAAALPTTENLNLQAAAAVQQQQAKANAAAALQTLTQYQTAEAAAAQQVTSQTQIAAAAKAASDAAQLAIVVPD